jgi:4-hydroxybenzoate polyprenyltransferase
MNRFLAYAQLVRLPNAFTAMADIALAALATGALQGHIAAFICVLLASVSLYSAGMVLNDYFDLEQDLRERPFRPLPSGRVTRRTALLLGLSLLAAGVAFAALADSVSGADRWRALIVAGLLVGAILLYDGVLKRTGLGPIAMGSCRFLNILLGMTANGQAIPTWGWLLALAIGTYIAGVTWFARTEAHTSNQNALMLAAAVMLVGLLLALAVPALAQYLEADVATSRGFPYLLVAFAGFLGLAVLPAIAKPAPQRVQAAVKRSVLGLVLLDAILATGLIGLAGLALVILLAPAALLGKWIYST